MGIFIGDLKWGFWMGILNGILKGGLNGDFKWIFCMRILNGDVKW